VTGATIARIRELLTPPDEIGSQLDPSPAVNKASFAQEEALRKRDTQVFKLARELIESRDVAASKFLLDVVRANPDRWIAGELAMALAGVKRHAPYMAIIKLPSVKDAAPPEILRGLAEIFERHTPTDTWKTETSYLNPLAALEYFWTAGVVAMLLTDREHAAKRLAPMLSPEATTRVGTEKRFGNMVRTVLSLEPPREMVELVVTTLSSLARAKKLDVRWTFPLVSYVALKGHEAERAHLLELDCEPGLLRTLFQAAADPSVRKRTVPAIAAIADKLRSDPAAFERLKIADATMGMKGALLAADPKKKMKLPKAPPKVKFAATVGTDGGPILLLPKEAAKAWQGVLRADGSVSSDGDFAGTDYQRACDAGAVGFIEVGKHQALVLGNQGCDVVLPKEGGCILVLSGNDEETVYAALDAGPKWRALKGSLASKTELLMFDAAMEQAKTKNKKVLKLSGRYAVEQVGDADHTPWLVRLVRKSA